MPCPEQSFEAVVGERFPGECTGSRSGGLGVILVPVEANRSRELQASGKHQNMAWAVGSLQAILLQSHYFRMRTSRS